MRTYLNSTGAVRLTTAGSYETPSYHLCLSELVLQLIDVLLLLAALLLVLFHVSVHLLQLLLVLRELLPGLKKISRCAAVAGVPQCLTCLQLCIFPHRDSLKIKTHEVQATDQINVQLQ